MADVSVPRRAAQRSPIDTVVDRIWRFFCSVKAAVWEIVFLTVLVLIGTLRGSSVPRWIADWIPATSGLVDRWYAWDVWHSLPFMGILTLLAVAITICTVNRAPGIWQSIAHPTVSTTRGFLRNADLSATVTLPEPRSQAVATISQELRSARYRVLTEERANETHVYADRFRWGKLGTFPFHLALITVLVGGVVGAKWGFRENAFLVPEGVTRPVEHGTAVSVRVDDFQEVYRETGTAKEFRSTISIIDNGEEVKTGSVSPNHPMTYNDMVFYQSGFGQAVHIDWIDPTNGMVVEERLPLGEFQSKNNPDAPAAVINLVPAGVQLTVVAPDDDPANRPELDQLKLRSGQMFLQVSPLPGNTAMTSKVESVINQGETVNLGGIDFTFVREKRFTVLQVARNPAIPLFIASSFLLVGGLACTFYFPHRRIRGIIADDGAHGSQVMLAPMARRDWSAKRSFTAVTERLQEKLGVPVLLTDREQQELAPDTA